jgi:hypothetical protein
LLIQHAEKKLAARVEFCGSLVANQMKCKRFVLGRQPSEARPPALAGKFWRQNIKNFGRCVSILDLAMRAGFLLGPFIKKPTPVCCFFRKQRL